MRVMHIRQMRMLVFQRLMPMRMSMWFTRRITRCVFVLMVLIVEVGMGMLHRGMNVLMLMMLGQMQPHADAHQ